MRKFCRAPAFALAWILALGLAAPLGAETVIISGATLHTASPAGTIAPGTIRVRDGRIEAVGYDGQVEFTDGVRWIEARGRHVTPGLIDGYIHGGAQPALNPPARALQTTLSGTTASGRVFDAVDGLSVDQDWIHLARGQGITRVALVPPPNPWRALGGRVALLQTSGGGRWPDRPAVAMTAWLHGFDSPGSEPGRHGLSRAARAAEIREVLAGTRAFALERAGFEVRDWPALGSRMILEALLTVVSGEIPLVVTAHSADEILAVLRLADGSGLRVVVHGGTEAWKVADELADAGVALLLDPLLAPSAIPPRLESRPDAAAMLAAAGVRLAFVSGAVANARRPARAAGNAVAHGLSWDAALAALTRAPAQILGLADSLGSLEPGKQADLVLWDGDPLEVTSFPDRVFIAGVEVSAETRLTRLRDRYLTVAEDWPPAYRRSAQPQ